MGPLFGQWSAILDDHTTIMLSIDPDRPGAGLSGIRFGTTRPDNVAAALYTVVLMAQDREWIGIATPYRAFSKKPASNYSPLAIPATLVPAGVSVSSRFAGHQLDVISELGGQRQTFSLTGLMPRHRRSIFTPMSWAEYSEWVSKQPPEAEHHFLYRGHKSSNYSLLTSLHRRHFSDLLAYSRRVEEVARNFYGQKASAVADYTRFTQTLIEMQHHGYPTPLLDWTWSPWIAAYFALSDSAIDPSEFGLIFQLPRSLLSDRALGLLDPRPIVSILDPEGLEVPRATTQQSVFTFSNVWDIEQWVAGAAAARGQGKLEVIGVPKSEMAIALHELRERHISERTMFPDLDGACREFRALHYGV